VTVEEFLQAVRALEPSVKQSVAFWCSKQPKGSIRRPPRAESKLAPDGKPYDDGNRGFTTKSSQ
jgi:hypothetical protein